MLSLEAVTAGYGGAAVLQAVSLVVEPGQLWAVLGRNGAGKSSVVRVACGLLTPSAGQVRLGGVALAGLTRAQVARQLAWVPQQPTAGEDFTARELVLFGRAPWLPPFGLPGEGDAQRVEEALREVGALALADRAVATLSGGERRLVWLARALAQAPAVLLLDEPTAFLDVKHQLEVLAVVRARVEAGLSALAVLHDPSLAMAFATHALLLEGGRVVAQGPVEAVLTAPSLSQLYGTALEAVGPAGARAFLPAAARRSGEPRAELDAREERACLDTSGR